MIRPVSLTILAFSAAILSCTLLFKPALAADVPPVPAPLVTTNGPPTAINYWTGSYIGAHLGWGWSHSELTQDHIAITTSSDGSGLLGGVQGGFNYQFLPNYLVGLEGQFSWTGAEDINWITTLGPRVGYIFGGGFVYAKGGVAWAGVDLGPTLHAFNGSETRIGWFIGVGVEHALWNQFSAKVEYNFVDLGSDRLTFAGPIGNITSDVDQRAHILKAGINYRFGFPIFASP